MNTKNYRNVLLCVGLEFFCHQQSTLSFDNNIQSVTILIQPTVSNTCQVGNGSGVIINKRENKYMFITAAHVVRNRTCNYSVVTADGKRQQLNINTVRVLQEKTDLAIGEFTSNGQLAIAKIGISANIAEGNNVSVSGYAPNINFSPVYTLRKGEIIANSNNEFSNGYAVVYSSNTVPGMSGGGVFNSNNELIAIHGRGDVLESSSLDSSSPEIRFKTGYDLGIPIDTFVKLARQIPSITLPRISQQQQERSTKQASADFFLKGIEKMRDRKFIEAIDYFDRTIQLNPQDSAAYAARALSYSNIQNKAAALENINRAIALNNKVANFYLIRAILLIDNPQTRDKSITDVNKAIQVDPNNSMAYIFRATFNLKDGKTTQASFDDFEKSIALNPSSSIAYMFRGLLYYGQKKMDLFRSDLEKVKSLSLMNGDMQQYQNATSLLDLLKTHNLGK
jgi:tetratricopeptide (TPR) repeat protein